MVGMGILLLLSRHSGKRAFARHRNPDAADRALRVAPEDETRQLYVGAGRYRRTAPMITTTKKTSTMPWATANGGSAGGTLGASACSTGTFRNDWITSTNMLR